jgi:membrane-associated phospholipid phosphatase
MRKLVLTVPEVAFIAATRGALGFGAGLLLSEKFNDTRRRKVGLGLLALGIATTIPAARKLFGRHSQITVASS